MIGVLGVIGGISGSIIDKQGLRFAYIFGVTLLSIASILLVFTSKVWIIPFIASSLFGASYIFLTGVLLVWGVKIFVKNASLGIGIPFLMLAVGQVIGSMIAGTLIDSLNYAVTFMVYGIVGLVALAMYPKVEVTPSRVENDQEYTKMQQENREVIEQEFNT